jgi:hypothetical protein
MVSSEGENIVFLLSMPRAGSTLLSLLLGSHSKIFCPPEPWFLLKVSALTQPGDINSVFNDEWATKGTKDFLHGDIFIEAARSFAATAYNKHLLASGKTIFVDKTPRYYHILPFIDELFPKARKIWLKRNPLDVALSYKNTWGRGVETITGQRFTAASFDFAAGLFNFEAYFNDLSPYKFQVQYEALVQSPAETLADICHFMNIQFEAGMLDYIQNKELISRHKASVMGDKKALTTPSVNARSVGKWARGLALTEIQQIVDFLGFDIFRRMGYSETMDTLQALGIQACSEAEAAEARRRIRTTNLDRMAEMDEQLKYLTAENRNLNFQVSQLRNSWSWKITAPLRKVGGVLIRLKELSNALSNLK